MKNKLLFMCMVAIALTACHKPEPEPNNDNPADTTETVVKKYLVKQLLNDDPEKIMLAIDWNDDFTKILNVKYGTGNSHLLDYDFTYYDGDSICVSISMPQDSYPLWWVWYDTLMIHLQQDKIDSICCYSDGILRDVEHYYYNDEGQLIERKYSMADTDYFVWNGDDVVECKMYGMASPVTIDSFTNYIYPQYTLPFYLSSEVVLEIRQPLFTPLWKHQPVLKDYVKYEADEDGYLTKMIYDSAYWVTYYYTALNN